jgi:hypothetical protein
MNPAVVHLLRRCTSFTAMTAAFASRQAALMSLGALCLLLASGCSEKSKEPSEAQVQANALINETFVGNHESWFAAEKFAGKIRLIQLRHPRPSLVEQSVTDTQRLNGVTVLAVLSLTCEQQRTWDGAWSEWKEGMGGGAKGLVVAMTSGLLADWSIHLEKKNGTWSARNSTPFHDFQQNKSLLQSLLQKARP